MKAYVSNWIRVPMAPYWLSDWAHRELILDNPEYEKRKRLGKWIGDTPQTLSLYVEDAGAVVLPFGCAQDFVRLAKEHGSAVEYETDFAPFQPLSMQGDINLYPYQQRAVEAMARGKNGVLEAPCGSGKTQMGLALIKKVGGKALWLTHTRKLLEQSKERAERYFQGDFGEITDGKVNIGKDITFATVQTMADIDPAIYREAFSCVVVDECQHVCGTPTQVMMFYKIICNMRCRHKYGVSATLSRADGLEKCIYATIGPKLHTVTQEEVGSKIVKSTHVPVMNQKHYEISDYCGPDGMMDYNSLVSMLCEDGERDAIIAQKVKERALDGSKGQLLLTSRVAHAERLSSLIPGASLVCGKVKESARDYLAPVIVATYQLAKEGLDIPSLDTLHLCTPTKDPIAVKQSAGRVERACEGKLPPVVYDYVDEDIPYCLGAYRKRKSILRK